MLYENEVSCERFTCAIFYWVPKHVYRHHQMCLKPLRKKVYSVAFEHRKTGDRVCLNEANYVTVNDTKLGIAPIVVERVGLSEYVFFNLKPPFPTNFLKSRFGREAKLPVDLMYGSNRIEERCATEYAHNLREGLQSTSVCI